ncbi:hypothetical protein [Nostoc sp. CCY 9925]|uniref:hypothetical protein n=1 Tax=Nostoc sp. CCY 9925 TaxID=3103865 RepID=UPI0039C69A81
MIGCSHLSNGDFEKANQAFQEADEREHLTFVKTRLPWRMEFAAIQAKATDPGFQILRVRVGGLRLCSCDF